MNAPGEQKIEQVFAASLEMGEDSRAAYLEQACGADVGLRQHVQRLLDCHDRGTDFMEKPVALADVIALASAPDPERLIGRRIGKYTLQERLGEGGMAVVFKAMQDQPRRTVAIKVLKGLSPGGARRFAREAQVLARLQHPGIAQVYEAGEDDWSESVGVGGLRYFAMEYVEGRPITDYATGRGLDTKTRLELILRVCDAVQYAHERGVIHRDLKPGNILVGERDLPKVLDFGVARVLEGSDSGGMAFTTLHTALGQIVGTLAYMSPEQAAGLGPVDARCDVYSLGVLLYELLGDRLPFDLHGRPTGDAIRMILEDEPAPLSSINRVFRGDVDTIVGKALQKDPGRRYPTVTDLADDLRRYLSNETIAARPVSTLYQVSRFARRNRGLVAGLATAFVALVLGLVGTTWKATEATRARDRAIRAVKTTQAAYDLLTGILSTDDAWDDAVDGSAPLSVAGVLDSLDDVTAAMQDDPLRAIDLRIALAQTLWAKGRPDEATTLAQASLKVARSIPEAIDREMLIMYRLGSRKMKDRDIDAARELFHEAMERWKEVVHDDGASPLGLSDHWAMLQCIGECARMELQNGRPAEAERLCREVAAMRVRLPPEQRWRAAAWNGRVGQAIAAQGRFEEAEAILTETCLRMLEDPGPRHSWTARAFTRIETMYMAWGRPEQAERWKGMHAAAAKAAKSAATQAGAEDDS